MARCIFETLFVPFLVSTPTGLKKGIKQAKVYADPSAFGGDKARLYLNGKLLRVCDYEGVDKVDTIETALSMVGLEPIGPRWQE